MIEVPKHTTSPVTIENLPDRDFTSEQVANKLPTTSMLFNVGIVEIPEILCRATVLIYLQGITAKDFYYSYVKKHRSCWELVGSLSGAAPVKFRSGEILICDRTRSVLSIVGTIDDTSRSTFPQLQSARYSCHKAHRIYVPLNFSSVKRRREGAFTTLPKMCI